MYCSKCGNEINEGEKFCSKCGAKNKNKSKVVILIIVVVCIIAICIAAYFLIFNGSASNKSQEENQDFVQASANIETNNLDSVSFENINVDDENLNEIQKDIINYFDDDYFFFYSKEAQKYPQVFQGAKVTTTAAVVKVLKSTNEEFEVLAVDCGLSAYNYYEDADIDDIPVEQLIVISGKQLNERLTTNNLFCLYGKYIDVENTEIDGKTYMVSRIDANNIVKLDETGVNTEQKLSFNKMKNVAEYIFGKDIKVNEAVQGQDYKNNEDGYFYKITLDNQSNANFKVFNMYKSSGLITYNKIHNGLSDNIQKRLFIKVNNKLKNE